MNEKRWGARPPVDDFGNTLHHSQWIRGWHFGPFGYCRWIEEALVSMLDI